MPPAAQPTASACRCSIAIPSEPATISSLLLASATRPAAVGAAACIARRISRRKRRGETTRRRGRGGSRECRRGWRREARPSGVPAGGASNRPHLQWSSPRRARRKEWCQRTRAFLAAQAERRHPSHGGQHRAQLRRGDVADERDQRSRARAQAPPRGGRGRREKHERRSARRASRGHRGPRCSLAARPSKELRKIFATDFRRRPNGV